MPKRILQGTVISDATDKTVVIKVVRRFKHPLYKKFITRSKHYSVHDADNKCKTGDVIRIVESAPISKTKKWAVLEVVESAAAVA